MPADPGARLRGARARRDPHEATPLTCPSCGEPVEARFNLCPTCGVDLRARTEVLDPSGDRPPGVVGEFANEAFGIDRTVLSTLGALLRDPGEIAAAASRPGPSRYARPLRLYMVVSFLTFLVYGGLAWITGTTSAEVSPVAPDELALQLDLQGPDMRVGSEIRAQIEAAGGVDPWLEETGRLEGRSPIMAFVARRGLILAMEDRVDDAVSSFADNRALISLLGIPLLTGVFALLFFGRAPLRAHLNLAAVLVSTFLLVDVVVGRLLWLGLAGVGLTNPTTFVAVLALQPLLWAIYSARAIRTFHGFGWPATLALTPPTVAGLMASYILAAWALSAVFLVLV